MELRHLRYFVAVAEELNFRRAAKRLHISQPPLTTQLQQLEEEIGAKLLERDSHHVALTAAGNVFLRSCRQLLRDADTAAQAARRAAGGETGQLAVGFIASLAHGIVPNLLRDYRRRFPEVELILAEMDTSQQLEELRERRLDVGLMGASLPLENAELESVVIAQEPLIAALPEDHSLAQRRTLQLAELAREKFVLASRQNASGYNGWLIRICENAGFEPQIARESYRRTTTVLNYVAAGFGVTIVPAQFSRVPTSGIVFVPLARRTPLYRYSAVWHRDARTPVLETFITAARAFMPRVHPETCRRR
ncbi:MAG: LysR family transcriptional regulator [Candidatus Eremiobacteraeota bacterium]|nr:LysR family transcriptional regulator [Candidatus Eremiobacteraeota bacterium]